MATAGERPISSMLPGDKRNREPRRWLSGCAMRMTSASDSIAPSPRDAWSRVALSKVYVMPLSGSAAISMSSVSESRSARFPESEDCRSSMAGLDRWGSRARIGAGISPSDFPCGQPVGARCYHPAANRVNKSAAPPAPRPRGHSSRNRRRSPSPAFPHASPCNLAATLPPAPRRGRRSPGVDFEPLGHTPGGVDVGEVVLRQAQVHEHVRQIAAEALKSSGDGLSSRNSDVGADAAQPIPHDHDGLLWQTLVRADVLTRDVRDVRLITVPLPVQDQTGLLALAGVSESLGPQEHSEFEWHVETRQTRVAVDFDARDVVDPQPAVADDTENLVHTDLAAVVDLEGATGPEAAVEHRKGDCFADRSVLGVAR